MPEAWSGRRNGQLVLIEQRNVDKTGTAKLGWSMDFDKTYRRVTFFGTWAEETADGFGQRDAITVLEDAIQRCQDEDVRGSETFSALDYLKRFGTRQGAATRLKRALDISDPLQRFEAARTALNAIKQNLGKQRG